MNWILLPFCHLTLMSFCTQGLPGIAESTFQKVKENLLPGVRFPSRRLRVLGKLLLPGPQPTSATVPTLFEGVGNLLDDGFCDFAFGSAQNDRGGKYNAEIENFRNRENNHIEKPNIPTKKGFVVMCIEF